MTMPDEPTEGWLSPNRQVELGEAVASLLPLVVTFDIPAVSLAECRRREAIAGNRGCWNLTTITPLVHVDGCECVAGDGFMLDPDEPTDPRCKEGEPYAAVVLDDGQYTLAVINLTAYAQVVEDAVYGGDGPGELQPIVVSPDGTPSVEWSRDDGYADYIRGMADGAL